MMSGSRRDDNTGGPRDPRNHPPSPPASMASPSRAPVHRSTSSLSTGTRPPTGSKTIPASTIISKGATARSAVSPRVSPALNGRGKTPTSGTSPRSSPVPSGELHPTGRDALVASLKRETDEKEELLHRLQQKEAHLAELTSENTSLTSTLHAAETRLAELYADQSRMEEDIATRIEISEKLRTQVRDLEREKRDALRRYTEQTATFEAERQALYDNEQHLKSRIQILTAAKKQEVVERPASPVPSIAPSIDVQPASPKTPVPHLPATVETEVSDGPEITALKLELSTLSTSHTSLQTMVQMLQTELADLKRVNHQLQEENESYSLLLMERAMNGTGVDMLRQMRGDDQSSSRAETISFEEVEDGERASVRSVARSRLDRVSEDDELALEGGHSLQDQPNSLASELQATQDMDNPPSSRRRRTRPNSASPSPRRTTPVGESLGDLPITGPGLDLAAELGRAETKDMLEGRTSRDSIGMESPSKTRSSRKLSDVATEPAKANVKEIDALRQEVKSLKDANKALSLYASKIIDRIIMQEGFEQVLAVDYDSNKASPTPKSPGAFDEVLAKARESPQKPNARPQSFFISRPSPSKPPATSTVNKLKFPTTAEPENPTTLNSPPSPTADAKRNRRSLSFDWKSFTMFGGNASASSSKEKYLKPLTLRPGAGSALAGARKLESQEDEDDRKERERLNATMKLMGIEKPPETSAAPPAEAPPAAGAAPEAPSTKPPSSNRFSFFRSMTLGSATQTAPAAAPAELTREALEQAEAETTLASLDAREKVLSVEIAKGGTGGFTELNAAGQMSLGDQWRSRRTRSTSGKSHDSSGASTVWSAGLKGDDE